MVDGRMWIKIPEIKGTPAQASALEELVRRLEGVTTVQAHPTMRNALILFASATIRAEAILETLRSAGSHPSRRVPMQPRNTALPTIVVEHAVTHALEQLLLVCLRSGTGGAIRYRCACETTTLSVLALPAVDWLAPGGVRESLWR
jgi:hypothetical protein